MKSLVPWERLSAAYSNGGPKELKDQIEQWLMLESDSERKVKLVEELLDPSSESNSLPLQLLAIKYVLDASGTAIKPGTVFGSVRLKASSVEWLADIAKGKHKQQSVSLSVRGTTLSVFKLIIRRFPKDMSKFSSIATALQKCISDAADSISDETIDQQVLFRSSSAILINQVVDVLEMAGDPQLPWLRPVCDCVGPITVIIQYFCSIQYDVQEPSSSSLNQVQIKVCKAFSMVVEIFTTLSSTSDSESFDIVLNTPTSLTKLVSNSLIVHDIYQSAYQSAIDLLVAFDKWTVSNLKHYVDEICHAIMFQDQQTQGGAFPYNSVLHIRRTESLLGLVCCVIDNKKKKDEDVTGDLDSPNSIPIADSIARLIESVMRNLKLSVSKEALNSNECTFSLKDCRLASSDARKGCITLANSLFTNFPDWIVRDVERAPQFNPICWNLSVEVLSTPLLFGAIIGACTFEAPSIASLDFQTNYVKLREKIFNHVQTALRNVSKYSFSAACDVLCTIEELSDLKCMEELLQDDFMHALLDAFFICPKGLQQKSKKSNDEGSIYDWKLRVMLALKHIFDSAKTSKQVFSDEVSRRIVSDICFLPFILLQASLGNVLSEHAEFLAAVLSLTCSETETQFSLASWYDFSLQNGSLCFQTPTQSYLPSTKEKCRKEAFEALSELLEGKLKMEQLVGLLHAVTLGISSFLDVVMTSRATLQDSSSQYLYIVVCYLKEISSRQLLFEDDGMQLCGELELISRFVQSSQMRSPSQRIRLCDAKGILGIYLQTCYQATADSFQLGQSFAKIIYELSYNELVNILRCLCSKHLPKLEETDEVFGEIIPSTFDAALIKYNNGHRALKEDFVCSSCQKLVEILNLLD